MPNGKGFRNHADSKTQPAEAGGRKGAHHGDGHDFNIKGKITSTKESCYHDTGKGSGAYGNFAEKDAQLAYLKDRNMKGQVVNSYSGNSRESRMHTGNIGQTAYNSKPIPEVYKPATSHHEPPAEAVEYKTKVKPREA